MTRCAHCGADISGLRSIARYCSWQCGRAARRAATMPQRPRDCAHCGAAFVIRRTGTRFCSPRCRDAAYRAANRERKRAASAAWRAANPERERARCAAYYAANRERARAYDAAYAAANPERKRAYGAVYRAAHPERQRARNAAYRAAHPEIAAASTARYRARKLGADGSHTLAEWTARVAAFGGRCAYCQRHDRPLERDHVIALVDGGTNDIGNIVPACRSCNAAKGTRTAAEFIAVRKVA